MTRPSDSGASGVEWGAEIVVNGKRPEWLGIGFCKAFVDSDGIFGGWTEDYEDALESDPADWKWVKEDGTPRITRIRLPADHPHYRQPQPADTVTVGRMTEAEAREWVYRNAPGSRADGLLAFLALHGALITPPSKLDRFMAAHPDADRATAEKMLAWGEGE